MIAFWWQSVSNGGPGGVFQVRATRGRPIRSISLGNLTSEPPIHTFPLGGAFLQLWTPDLDEMM